MDIEAAIRARLIDDVAVADLVAGKVYWVERIEGESYPGITLQVFNEDRAQHLKGFHTLQRIDVQVDAWALTHAAGKAIKDAAITALVPQGEFHGFKFNRAFVRARDLSERVDDRTIFRPSMDFTFHYSPAS